MEAPTKKGASKAGKGAKVVGELKKLTPKKKAAKAAAPKKAKQVVYLKEGVTGKQFMQGKIETNNAYKKEGKTLSYCIKKVKEHDKFSKSIKGYKATDLTPKNLLPLRTETEAARGNFSPWLVMMLVSRFYKAKHEA